MSEEEIVDAEVVEEQPRGPLRVAVIGGEDNPLAKATYHAFDVPKGVETSLFSVDQIDDAVAITPNVVFWCEPIDIKKNDMLEDSDIIAGIQKLVRTAHSGICIRSTINIETHDRLIMALQKEVFDAKIVYMPNMSDSSNINDIIRSRLVVGGAQEALQAHVNVMRGASWFDTSSIIGATVAEVVYAKLAVAGYNVIRQKYFDEIHEAVMDMKGANPMVVNQMTTTILGEDVVPSYVNQSDVYASRVFAGATDKLTLIESCLEN